MAETLGRLSTFLGERSVYDAVSQCSRCGYCEQSCPTYLSSGREDFSPRGRNQLVRMIMEGKLADPSSAERALSTCLLCGACSSACPARVPTADIVLEGRRALRERTPWAARALGNLLLNRPRAVAALLRGAYSLKRWGLAALASGSGLLRVLGLGALGEAGEHLEEAPRELLRELLAKDLELRETAEAAWLYFPVCGTAYVLPRVGLATIRTLKKLLGRGASIDAPYCGLLSYNYGDLETARALARAAIERLEASPAAACPVVADCSSCAAHMKSFPQLFLDDPAWKARAERFSSRIRDVIEVLPGPMGGEGRLIGPPEPVLTYHDSCRAKNGEGVWREPRSAMSAACGDAYRELPESDQCCGGAGAFALAHPELSEELLRRKVSRIASVGARVVAASSTSCLLQLARGLKKYYPECRAVHLTELVSDSLERGDG